MGPIFNGIFALFSNTLQWNRKDMEDNAVYADKTDVSSNYSQGMSLSRDIYEA